MPENPVVAPFQVGRGISDITGEAAGCGMLGYGKADQQTAGIHQRLRARAFILDDGSGDGVGERVLLIVADLPLVFDSIHRAVLAGLAVTYDDRYSVRNTMITATHTHCGPGGYAHHRLYNSTTGGFRPQTFAAIVDGILEAVHAAHADLSGARLALAHGELRDASSNRSPSSFRRNPSADRTFFPDEIDPQTTLLTVVRAGRLVGVVNWFATHGTSMTNQNHLISGDNKGYAAYHWERLVEGQDYLDRTAPGLVAAFAQTNTGDMSPNLNHRPGSGPTEDEFENTRIIGNRQYEAAAKLAAEGGEPLEPIVDSRLTYVDLGDITIRAEFAGDGLEHRTGRPNAGAAALAGTDEGAGFRGFRQGSNPLWDHLSRGIYRASPRLRDAHAPKGLVLPAGLLNKVVPLVAERYPVQLIRIGRLYLIGIPGEVTIVAGLRLRRTVAAIVGADLRDVLVVGYANGYFHYVTTPEEYDEQRYEGGSTLFGRWQLPALQQVAAGLAEAMRDGRPVATGLVPPPLTGRASRRGRRLRPRADRPMPGTAFGDVLTQPRDARPGETVHTEIVGAHLGVDLRRGSTYLEIERAEQSGRDDWRRVADDSDWATRLRWTPHPGGASIVAVAWDVPLETPPGTYRLQIHGSTRDEAGAVRQFTAVTDTFTIDQES